VVIEPEQKDPANGADDSLKEHRQLIDKIRETDGCAKEPAHMQIQAFEMSFAEL
jgi:hypothetical protein